MTGSSPKDISLDRVARLLDGFVDLSSCARQREAESFDRLLRGLRPKWEAFQAHRRQNGSRFNVFDALNARDKEVFHSRFLAYLLDPGEHHDQGERFLRGFLQRVLGKRSSLRGTARAIVQRELPVGDWGQLDICICLPSHVIAIENKIHALEGDNQIGRYHEWLESQCKGEGRERTLIFLTPRGNRPLSAPSAILDQCICLSYADLADILWMSIQEMDGHALKLVIEQYVEICRDLHRSYGGESDEQRGPSIPDGSWELGSGDSA